MVGLLYREDMDEVRKRLTAWWNGEDIGRPAIQITAPRPVPLETFPAVPKPDGAGPDNYTTKSFEYREYVAKTVCAGTYYLGDAAPWVRVDLGPNSLALYLGCHGVETPTTVWFEPCMNAPEDARFEYDRENFYWDFTLRLTRELLRVGAGKFLLQYPDLIEGLDTLAAMRGSQTLLTDLIDRPDWVQRCLRQITDRYFHHYDILYDLMRDEVGGSVFWCWAPGRMAKFQCDFSAMISPAMFGEFMVPVLKEMTERVSYSMYHWDGPGAIPHHDHLLSIPALDMLQWTPGAGNEPHADRRWWPLYHKTIDAGKKVYCMGCHLDSLKAMKKEFGPKLKQFLLSVNVKTPRDAEEYLRVAEK
ncbi:MAG: hypothetical protein NTW86_17475 [Candidatus Sumerlaeota bacterium]|nr:hypothetical protein [Candidatus Sumerlaeota bacterium]